MAYPGPREAGRRMPISRPRPPDRARSPFCRKFNSDKRMSRLDQSSLPQRRQRHLHRRALRPLSRGPAIGRCELARLLRRPRRPARAVREELDGPGWGASAARIVIGQRRGRAGQRPRRRRRSPGRCAAGGARFAARGGADPRPIACAGHLIADLDPLGLDAAHRRIPISIPRPMASPRPIWTGRSSSTTCWASRPRPCARSSPR